MDVKTTLVGIILLGFFNIVDTQVTVPEPDIEACHGEDVLLTWIFSDEQDLDTAQWKKGTTLIMTKVGAGAAVAAAGYTSKFQHVSNGEIRLLNTELTDTATYQLDVSYSLTSGLPSDFGSLNVKALDPPSSPTGFCTDGSTRMCYCRASYIGSPAVDVRIKVDEDLKSTANSSILSTETAYCCVVGEAVKCLEKECVIIAGTTTTSTTTTTITSSTTSMKTSSTITTTTSILRISTTNISTSTTSITAKSTVTSTNSTVIPPSTSRGSITRTSPMTTTVTHVSIRDSDKAIVTMIIVVSVIGGVLIMAIFAIIFLMMHWKSCFTRRSHSKQYSQRSDHRKQHRQAGYNATGRFFITRQDHAMRGYYFYDGTYKNPLFCDQLGNSSYLNNYYPNQKNSHDPKYMPSHEVYQYNYDGDYNWDLKDSY